MSTAPHDRQNHFGLNRLHAADLACLRGGRPVFAGVSFDLNAGDILRVSGHNGAGKSTLLRLVAGLTETAFGNLIWNGEPVRDGQEDFHAALHYIGHADPVHDQLTLRENLRFAARLMGVARAQTAPAIDRAARRLRMTALLDMPLRIFSSGQRRRANLMRLLLQDRPLWLLDEPSVGLDVESVATLEILLEEHRRVGGIIMLSTHSRLTVIKAQTLDLNDFQVTGDPETDLFAAQNSDLIDIPPHEETADAETAS